ncbi:MAG: tetratricopeptide repeat protein [Thermoguttaceae bacterium]
MRAFLRSSKARLLLAGLAAITSWALLWAFSRRSPDGSSTAAIVRTLRQLEAEADGPQKPEISALDREAMRVARQLMERYPEIPEALDAVAWAHLQFGRRDAARRCWERSLEIDPTFGDGHFWLGRLAYDAQDHALAAQRFQQAIDHRTTNLGAPAFLAKSLQNLGRLADAAAVLEKESHSNANNPGVLVLLGQVYLQSRDNEKAREAFEKALAANPSIPRANLGLATVYARLGNPSKANQCTDKARQELQKEQSDQRKAATSRQDDTKAARETLAAVCIAAGKVCYAQGDIPEAEALWRRATQIAPYLVESRLVLAWAFERQGRLEDALEILAEAAKVQPASPEVHLRLGEVAVRLRRPDVAEKAFRDVLQLAPREPLGHAALADLYLHTGQDSAKALASIDRAIALAPHNEQFLKLRESILREIQLRKDSAARAPFRPAAETVDLPALPK